MSLVHDEFGCSHVARQLLPPWIVQLESEVHALRRDAVDGGCCGDHRNSFVLPYAWSDVRGSVALGVARLAPTSPGANTLTLFELGHRMSDPGAVGRADIATLTGDAIMASDMMNSPCRYAPPSRYAERVRHGNLGVTKHTRPIFRLPICAYDGMPHVRDRPSAGTCVEYLCSAVGAFGFSDSDRPCRAKLEKSATVKATAGCGLSTVTIPVGGAGGLAVCWPEGVGHPDDQLDLMLVNYPEYGCSHWLPLLASVCFDAYVLHNAGEYLRDSRCQFRALLLTLFWPNNLVSGRGATRAQLNERSDAMTELRARLRAILRDLDWPVVEAPLGFEVDEFVQWSKHTDGDGHWSGGEEPGHPVARLVCAGDAAIGQLDDLGVEMAGVLHRITEIRKPNTRSVSTEHCEGGVRQAGWVLSKNSTDGVQPAQAIAPQYQAENDLLEAALAELGDQYYKYVGPALGPRYQEMVKAWRNCGGASFMGGAPSVYIGDGTCTNVHVDRKDFAIPSSQGEQSCTVFSKFEYDGRPSRIVIAIQAYLSAVVHG